jgi:predicted RNase H-like HicB family nuclease
MKLIYPAIFFPDSEEGGYTVEIPDLPGCVTQGYSLEEAIDMGVDAASGWILGEWESGREVPAPSSITDVKPDTPSAFVNMLVLDMDAYTERFGNKAVRKNLTIPAWMNAFAETHNINFSKVLQNAIYGMMVDDAE